MATIPPTTHQPKPDCGCLDCAARHGDQRDPDCSCCVERRKLRGATAEQLLRQAYSLTHRIHAAERGRMPDDRLAIHLRSQRDRVGAELLHRCTR